MKGWKIHTSPALITIDEDELHSLRYILLFCREKFLSCFLKDKEHKEAELLLWDLPLILRESFIPKIMPLAARLYLTLATLGISAIKRRQTPECQHCGRDKNWHIESLKKVIANLNPVYNKN